MIPMKKCRAYYLIAGSRTVWIPCVQKAEAESGFCRRHGGAIVGAWLGAVIHEPEMNNEAPLEKDKVRRNQRHARRRT